LAEQVSKGRGGLLAGEVTGEVLVGEVAVERVPRVLALASVVERLSLQTEEVQKRIAAGPRMSGVVQVTYWHRPVRSSSVCVEVSGCWLQISLDLFRRFDLAHYSLAESIELSTFVRPRPRLEHRPRRRKN